MAVLIREEESADIPAIYAVNQAAFGRPDEAALVDRLRADCPAVLSLVAVLNGQVTGHALFTPCYINGALEGMALGPIAVLPGFQCQGIGGALIEAGLERLRAAGVPYSIVLGHAGYYPRFGYRPASGWGVACEFPGVPDEAFMLLPLDPTAKIPAGVAHYRAEFAEVT